MNYLTSLMTSAGGREKNEDDCGFVEALPFWCWVVADGLGGHRGGQEAARMTVKIILDGFKRKPRLDADTILQLFETAQSAILCRQEEEPRFFSMRSTAVILIAGPNGVIWGHIGDSRLYHFRRQRIIFQTHDHSVSQIMADAGNISPDNIRHHEDRNRLLRTLGNVGNLKADIEGEPHPVNSGDAFLLCTDGFWEHVTETEMEVDLACSSDPESWLKRANARIKSKAPAGHDNYTAVAIFANGLEDKIGL